MLHSYASNECQPLFLFQMKALFQPQIGLSSGRIIIISPPQSQPPNNSRIGQINFFILLFSNAICYVTSEFEG